MIIITVITFSNLIFAQEKYKLVEKELYGSCGVYKIIDKQGDELKLPPKFKEVLDCPAMINITDNILTYEYKNSICLYNLEKKTDVTLFINHNDIDACCGPVWSEDRNKVMFVIINQEKKHNYKAMCRIIVLTIDENNNVLKKQKFDRNVNFVCGNNCYSSPDLDYWFVNNSTIEFKLHEAFDNEFPTEKILLD